MTTTTEEHGQNITGDQGEYDAAIEWCRGRVAWHRRDWPEWSIEDVLSALADRLQVLAEREYDLLRAPAPWIRTALGRWLNEVRWAEIAECFREDIYLMITEASAEDDG